MGRISVNFHADNLIQPCVEAAVEAGKPLKLNIIRKENSEHDFNMQALIAKEYISNSHADIQTCAYVDTYEEAIRATTLPCDEIAVDSGLLNDEEIRDIIKVCHAVHRTVQVKCDEIDAVRKYAGFGADSVRVGQYIAKEASSYLDIVTVLENETIGEANTYFEEGVSEIVLDASLNKAATKTMRAQKEVNAFSIKVIEEYFRGYKEQIVAFLKEVA